MYRRNINRDLLPFKLGMLNYFVILILLVFAANNFNNYMKEYNPNNFIYINLLKYSMPIVKVVNPEEEALSEGEDTLTEQFIKILGFNMDNPVSLIGKEISFVKLIDTNVDESEFQKITYNIDPFSVNDSQVNKNSQQTTGDANILNPAIKKTLNPAKPEVLIYHTHTTESFSPNGNYNSDNSKNMVAVGDVITGQLENGYGVAVVHDKTVHNSSMVKAYARSAETLDRNINQYGSFRLIIDLHRDGGPEKASTTVTLNNQNAAKIMFVISKKSPYFNQNQDAVNKLMSQSNKIFPGFCRDKTVYKETGYYNQNKAPNTVLIEVGCEKNTIEEVKKSGEYIARIIAEYLSE